MRLCLFACALAIHLCSSAWSEEPKGTDLDGVWRAETAELAGAAFPESVRKAIQLEIKGGSYTVTIGKSIDKGSLKRDDSTKPRSLDIVGEEGPNKGRTILAIWERKGDTLQICYDLSGKNRPTEFESQEKTQLFLVTYKRQSP